MATHPPPSLDLTPDDLAPGDRRSAAFDWHGFSARLPRRIDDPAFRAAYALLWDEFGSSNELEPADVLARRFASPNAADARWRTHYHFVVIKHGDAIAAVVDHTAVIDRDRPDVCCVHLSHLLVLPAWRRTGLAGWARAVPIAAARRLMRDHSLPDRRVVLVGEVEHTAADRLASLGRLPSFERAGFLKIDPAGVRYVQPDFRTPAEIDADGSSRPVSLSLVLRQIGHEADRTIRGEDVRSLVESIYAVYAGGLRPAEMNAARSTLADYPSDDETVRLLPPTA